MRKNTLIMSAALLGLGLRTFDTALFGRMNNPLSLTRSSWNPRRGRLDGGNDQGGGENGARLMKLTSFEKDVLKRFTPDQIGEKKIFVRELKLKYGHAVEVSCQDVTFSQKSQRKTRAHRTPASGLTWGSKRSRKLISTMIASNRHANQKVLGT